MGFQVIITERATKDLSLIVERIASHNPGAAQKLGDRVIQKFLGLGRFPFLGRMVPERGEPQWRELVHESYRLIYQVDEAARVIYAARVWHAARGAPEF